MRTADAYKVRGGPHIYRNRGLANFVRPVEVGILVPLIDSKFLTSYEIRKTTGANVYTNTIPLESAIGNEIPLQYRTNFDDKYISNMYVGPSSASGYRGQYEIRPTQKMNSLLVSSDSDINGDARVLNMALSNLDNVALATQPPELRETTVWPGQQPESNDLSGLTGTLFTVRSPKMINVHGHANAMIGNIPGGTEHYIVFPLTDQGSINPLLLYRFSFYYRIKGSFLLTPYFQYFTNTGAEISSYQRSLVSLAGAATEETDFDFFDIRLPDFAQNEFIPRDCRRLRIVLKIVTLEDTTFEMAYPILEHAFNQSAVVSTLIPESPSSFKFKDIHSSEVEEDFVGTLSTFDSTRLFFGHIGRKMFDVSVGFSLADASIVDQLRTLENFNERGSTIVLRPQHHDLPPVLLGDMSLSQSFPTYSFHHNDMTLEFKETI